MLQDKLKKNVARITGPLTKVAWEGISKKSISPRSFFYGLNAHECLNLWASILPVQPSRLVTGDITMYTLYPRHINISV